MIRGTTVLYVAVFGAWFIFGGLVVTANVIDLKSGERSQSIEKSLGSIASKVGVQDE